MTKTPNFFFEKGAKPDPNVKWSGPTNPSAYFTTWSYYAIIATLFFAVISIPILYKYKNLQSSRFAILILAIIIGFSANTLAVGATSQGLMNYNWRPLDPNNPVLVKEEWLVKFNRKNLKVHLIPVIISIFLLVLITAAPWKGSKVELFCLSVFIPIIFFMIWLCVPVAKKKGSKEKTNPFNKASIVYSSPPIFIELLQPLVIILMCAAYVYIIRGNHSKLTF